MDQLFEVKLLRIAHEDVESIYCWLLKRSPIGANRWYLAFQEAAMDLSREPERFGLAPEANELTEAVRQRLFKTSAGRSYRILFLIVDAEVLVLRVRGPGQKMVQLADLE
ncbi:MAG: type II toxin-antitoxin system RelE/ParE family toxin [Pirellula sp.]